MASPSFVNSMRRSRAMLVFASVAGMLLVLGGCNEQAAMPAQPPPEVSVLTLKPQSVSVTTDLPGRTTAYLTADVRPQVSGVVTSRDFIEGADVASGQQLYQIDPATYQATYETGVASLAFAKAALISARAKAERYKPLAAAHAVSQQDLDDAVSSVGQDEANIATAQASIKQAQINLAYTKVMAPIAGRIGRSSITPGALVTSAQTTSLATVTQLDPIYVDVTQSSTMILRFRAELAVGKLQKAGANGAKVQLSLEDGSIYPLTGTLQFSEVNVDQGTGTVLTRAIFQNPNKVLLPGMFVHAKLQEGVNDQAFLVPQQSVSRNTHGDATVMVVDKDDKIALRIINATQAIGDKWIVTDGLKPGERLVVEGLQKVRPGVHVTVTEFAEHVPSNKG